MVRFLIASGLAALFSAASLAQTAAPPAPAATTAPVAAPRPSRPAANSPVSAPAPTGAKVNLNTASASELDALPQVGKVRSKSIIDERAKGLFKDWADFDKRMAHTSVNAGVKSRIKDLVAF